MWLPTEVADYISEETGEPASLWKVTYEDHGFGTEDLEEYEVLEAVALLEEELTDKIKKRIAKRQAKVAEAQKRARVEREVARLEEKARKAKQREQERQEKREVKEEVERLKAEQRETEALLHAEAGDGRRPPKPQGPDEATIILESGPYAGKPSSMVPKPKGSEAAFPPASLVQEFMPVFMFLRDLSNPLGAVRMTFEEIKNCLVSTSDQGCEAFCEVAKWLTDIAVRAKWFKEKDDEGERRDDDDEGEAAAKLKLDPMDMTLALGPLLNSRSKDKSNKDCVTYSCWQLVNESSWPELCRMMMQTSCIGGEFRGLERRLGEEEPTALTMEERLSLLRFLCDEACSSDKVQRVL
eukprot:CAMPEP_0114158336 /NCGR_PEP_ID=MMETSP0043_2-20121206/27150_1 /TAXON_ID=464988 /ORGANISM="Hemiselmis andersenii, Strain CCMP644" /LENGTH=353 /DNA_ID=CAMNT_0001254063 /DNA_START=28 /DNA_END=1086 /DNA_ORIENTATION=+